MRITIIGAGFAALTAIRTLRALSKQIDIDLIAPEPRFIYYPSTIWIPTQQCHADDLVIPLQPFFARQQVQYHPAKATGLSPDGRTVHTTTGDITNDGLIIASGGQFLRNLPGLEHTIIPCAGIDGTLELKKRLHQLTHGTIACGFASNPQEPAAMRGGPIFEFLFGIDTWLRRQKRRQHYQLIFFTPGDQPGKRLGPKAVQILQQRMAKCDIIAYLGYAITHFTAQAVHTTNSTFNTDLTLFMPGITGNSWFEKTPLTRSAGGLLQANALCQTTGADHVYVAGDAGSFPGPQWLPKQAHMADLQATAAAKNVYHALQGRPATARYTTELKCILDTGNAGILVTRTETKNQVIRANRGLHWAKKLFAWHYLRQYR